MALVQKSSNSAQKYQTNLADWSALIPVLPSDGPQTAALYAAQYGQTLDHELALYIIHGLLHLNGYEDGTARDASRMHRLQERLLRACLAEVSPL